jgi:hypothetical protein
VATESLFVAAEDDLVLARNINTDSIVGERLSGIDFLESAGVAAE